MPGKRANNNFFGGYIDRRLATLMKRVAKKNGMGNNTIGFAVQLISEGLQRRGVKVPEPKPLSRMQEAAERRFKPAAG